METSVVCLQGGDRRQLREKSRHQELLPILKTLCVQDIGERVSQEISRADEASMEHGTGAPRHANMPGLDHVKRDHRGVDQVS